MIAPLLDLAERAPLADTSLEAWDRISLDLKRREIEIFLALHDYIRATGFPDCTGGELAAWSGKKVTSVRPRLTGLKDKHWVEWAPSRKSRAGEWKSHPFRPCVPRSAIERLSSSSGRDTR